MNRNFLLMFLVSLLSFYLISCDGGDGKKEEEFTVFDVEIQILDVQGFVSDCPELANLKMSLDLSEIDINGHAELLDFGNLGDSTEVLGVKENGNFNLEPFDVMVLGDQVPGMPVPFPCCVLSLSIRNFEATLIDENGDGEIQSIEGMVSGDVLFGSGDLILCEGELVGEFIGKEKMPSGCISAAEITLDESRDCPAEAISNLCDGVSYTCNIPESIQPPGLFLIDNSWEAIDCITIGNPSPFITNLELGISGIIGGNFITTGEPLSCFGPPESFD